MSIYSNDLYGFSIRMNILPKLKGSKSNNSLFKDPYLSAENIL